jgi:tetratricopeptide (TPR) repeat protein
MNKRLLFSIFLFFSSFAILAQEGKGLKESELTQAQKDSNALYKVLEIFNQGVTAFNSGNYGLAIEKYEEVIATNPDYYKAYNNIAAIHVKEGDIPAAIELYERVYSVFDTAFKALYIAGNLAVTSYDNDKARTILDKLIHDAGNKSKSEYFYFRGVVSFQDKSYQEAVDYFSKAIEKRSTNAWAYHDRASAYKMMNELEKSLADYKAAIKIDPTLDIARTNMATVQVELGNAQNSLEGYDKALKTDPGNVVVKNKRGIARMKAGDYEGALEDFNAVIAKDPSYYLAYNNKAAVYIEQEEWDKAIAMCNKAIEIFKDYSAAYINRGIAKEMLRDVEGACADWEEAFFIGSEIAESYTNSPACSH